MKSINFIIACCSIFLPLVSADLLGGDPEQCVGPRDEEECNAIDNCEWMLAIEQCMFKVVEGCGFAIEQSSCETVSGCVWMTDTNDDRQGICKKMEDISEGNCIADGHVITSKASCNSVKGCSWTGSGDAQYCTVALTQLGCDLFKRDRATCKQEGCVFKRKKCMGRWEPQFLSSLVGMDGDEAKQAIQDEYGETTYNVALIKGKKPRRKKRNRILLFLDKEDRVKRKPSPKFG